MRGRSMCLKLGRGGAEAEARSMIGNKKCSRDAAPLPDANGNFMVKTNGRVLKIYERLDNTVIIAPVCCLFLLAS